MYDNEFRVIIILIGLFIIFYIFFISKNNRKYKVYKTKNYDIKKNIEIKTNNKSDINSNININLKTKNKNQSSVKDIKVSTNKPRQMSLSLGANEEKKLIIIHSIAKKYYNVKDIYFFMEENNIFINNSGYYEKFHINKHERFLKYSVTNISSPGYLNKENLTSPKIKGLSFFIQLPVKADSLNVFNEMVNDAKIFSKSYKGNLYNSDKELLSNKILKNLKNIAKSYKDEY